MSLVWFKDDCGMSIESEDTFKCRPLHFAVLNKQFKSVECLLGMGVDLNAQTKDGQSALHLAVVKMIEEPEEFEDLKRIIKELLFNGADRN